MVKENNLFRPKGFKQSRTKFFHWNGENCTYDLFAEIRHFCFGLKRKFKTKVWNDVSVLIVCKQNDKLNIKKVVFQFSPSSRSLTSLVDNPSLPTLFHIHIHVHVYKQFSGPMCGLWKNHLYLSKSGPLHARIPNYRFNVNGCSIRVFTTIRFGLKRN